MLMTGHDDVIFLVSLEGFSENNISRALAFYLILYLNNQPMSHTEYLELHAKRKNHIKQYVNGK